MSHTLQVSLSDKMHAFVNLRIHDEEGYTSPSEYVRALIEEGMKKEFDRLDVYMSLLQGKKELREGHFIPLSDLDGIADEVIAEFKAEQANHI